ncbi:MAG: type B 50S ribosomal protein L31 [Candidatus Magasanikbacteria bacterium]
MKKDTHPKVYPVVFIDTSCGVEFVTTSTMKSEKTRDIDGVTYFEIPIEISSASHPFYTGKQIFVDTARRVEKFQEKMSKKASVAEIRKGKKVKHATRAASKQNDEKKSAKKEAK